MSPVKRKVGVSKENDKFSTGEKNVNCVLFLQDEGSHWVWAKDKCLRAIISLPLGVKIPQEGKVDSKLLKFHSSQSLQNCISAASPETITRLPRLGFIG